MRRQALRMLGIVALLVLAGCGSVGTDDQLRMMVPNSPGGGYDVTARTAVKITETAGITGRVQVFNVIGGGGSLAMTRLMNENGNPELLMMMGLGVIGSTITNNSARVTGATPIARLLEEQEGVMVPASSPFRSVDELMTDWRAHPAQFDVGGGSLPGGPDHLLTMRIAAAEGIDAGQVRYVTHDGGGELLPALLGDEIDFAVSGVREYAEQIRSGQTPGAGGLGRNPPAQRRRADPDRIGNRRGVQQLAWRHRAARASPRTRSRPSSTISRGCGRLPAGRRNCRRTGGPTPSCPVTTLRSSWSSRTSRSRTALRQLGLA